MNILFIYPEFPDTFWSFKHALPFVHRKSVSPPLGLLTVAALLPAAWQKRLVDVNLRRLTAQDLAWADYAFIGAMSVQRESALRLIAQCKAAGVPVVAGGPLVTVEYDINPELYADVDHFVLNEAEITLPLFLADLERGTPQRVYRSDEMADVEQTPTPLWELADLKRYATMSLQYSRGCPYNCDFCNVTTLFGHRPRVKTAQQVIRELDGLYAQGWRGSIFFVDDNLIGNRKQLKNELLPALIKWRKGKAGMPFFTEVSINLADDEELTALMVQAGFTTVFVGIETPSEESLAECNKKHNLRRDLVQDVKRLQRAGLEVQGGFIVGFDSDTPNIFQRQLDFIQRSGIVTAMVGLLQAPPGTGLYARLKQAGRLKGGGSGDNADGETNIVPLMDAEVLRQGYRNVIRQLYSPAVFYQRLRIFLREYRVPPIKSPIEWRHVLAFLRSCVRLGVVGKERFEYWKLLFWTSFRRPRMLALAVTLAVYGYHFRKVTELHIS